jgi:hypothetical protein
MVVTNFSTKVLRQPRFRVFVIPRRRPANGALEDRGIKVNEAGLRGDIPNDMSAIFISSPHPHRYKCCASIHDSGYEGVGWTFPWSSPSTKQNGEETRSKGVDVDKTGQAWRGQALQRRTPLIGFIEKEMTMKGHLVAVAAGTRGSKRQDSATIGWRTIMGGNDEKVAKGVAGKGIGGHMTTSMTGKVL